MFSDSKTMATLVNYTCNSFIKLPPPPRVAQPRQEFPGVPPGDLPSFSAEKGGMRGEEALEFTF